MKNFIPLILQFSLVLTAVAAPVKGVYKVDMVPITSDEYPFVKALNSEREDNIIKFELEANVDRQKGSPLISLPEGFVCIKRKEFKLDETLDLGWIVDLYSENSIKENNKIKVDEEVELSNPQGDFVIRCESFDLFCYFLERPDKTWSLAVMKMNMLIENKGKVYFVGEFPSSEDRHSSMRITDVRVNKLIEKFR